MEKQNSMTQKYFWRVQIHGNGSIYENGEY